MLATFFIANISYAENVTVESNLRDNDHELEGNKRTKKICFKKGMHQQARQQLGKSILTESP